MCVVHEVPCSLSSLRGLINQSSRWPSQCTDGAAVIIRDRFIFHGMFRSQVCCTTAHNSMVSRVEAFTQTGSSATLLAYSNTGFCGLHI